MRYIHDNDAGYVEFIATKDEDGLIDLKIRWKKNDEIGGRTLTGCTAGDLDRLIAYLLAIRELTFGVSY